MISNKKKAQLAMFDEWANKPLWHCTDEGIALSLGEDPAHVNPNSIKHHRHSIRGPHSPPASLVVDFQKRLDLWQRYETSGAIESTVSPDAFLRFAEKIGMEFPAELKKAVTKASKRLSEAFREDQRATTPAAEAKPTANQAAARIGRPAGISEYRESDIETIKKVEAWLGKNPHRGFASAVRAVAGSDLACVPGAPNISDESKLKRLRALRKKMLGKAGNTT